MKCLTQKWIKKGIFKAWILFFVLQFLSLSSLAATLASLEIVSEERPYDSDNPVISKVSPEFKLGKGIVTTTYEISSYPGTGTSGCVGWGRVDEATYIPYFYHKERKTIPEGGAIVGQPYQEVNTFEVTESLGDILFYAWLKAPAVCQAFQVCHQGTQLQAKQKFTIDFQSADGIDNGNDPTIATNNYGNRQAEVSNDFGNGLPEIFIDYGNDQADVSDDYESGPADISGRWNSNIGFVYDIQQYGESFSWQVIAPISEQGHGTINGNEAYAEWSGDNGSGSGSATIERSGDTAVRIYWENGVVFSRE